MAAIGLLRLRTSVWYHSNVGRGFYGYQLFNWWIVDDTRRVPYEAALSLGCIPMFSIKQYHFLLKKK